MTPVCRTTTASRGVWIVTLSLSAACITMTRILLCTLLLMVCQSICRASGTRVALVIGCNRYTNLSEGKQLKSPVSDATDVAATLKSLGYTLVTGAAVTDAGKDAIITATEGFAGLAREADAAVFYFSGHGIQVGEDNFLMPSDTPRITSYTVLKNRSVHLRDTVMVALEEAKAKTKVIILDCCRENPFAEQVNEALGQIGKTMRSKGGLGEISGYGPGFFLAFATSPGTLADDGNGHRNSPFTAALLTHLKTSAAEDITPLFRKVKASVRQTSGEEQVPWTNDSLDSDFSLVPGSTASPSGTGPAPPVANMAPVVQAPPVPSMPVTDLPSSGFFELDALFDGTTYDAYNRHSRVEILKKVQTKLKSAGLYASTVDGGMGPGTQSAILAWQRQQGIKPSGRLEKETLESLNLSGLAETPAPKPAAPAPIERKTEKVLSDVPPDAMRRSSQEATPAPAQRPSTATDKRVQGQAVQALLPAGTRGQYLSPFAPGAGVINAAGRSSGDIIICPFTGQPVRVP